MRTTSPSALAIPALLAIASHLAAQDAAPALPVPVPTNLLAAASAANGAYAAVIVFVNSPGHPTNVVPGVGIPFRTGGTATSAFERPTVSANGTQFAINVVASSATTNDDVLLLNSALLLREGSPAPWAPAENIGTIDADLAINDAGSILLGNNSSATTLDDYLAYYNASVWSVLAQEGGATPVGGTWSSTIDSTALDNLGGTYWRGTAITGLPTTNNALLVQGSLGQLRQKGIDIPAGQASGAVDAWENFTINRVLVAPDGATRVIVGDTSGATTGDLVLTVNDVVQIQEGQILPGSTFVNGVSTIGKAWIDRAGNWYARGSNATTDDDWLVRNGALVADSAGTSEVVAGSGEYFDDATFAACFFCFDGNNNGQFVFGGVTSAPATNNGVLVLDDGLGNRVVVAREGNPVDLDGNGLFDDDRFFNAFGDDDVLLLDDGTIHFTATLKNAAGTAVDQGLFRLEPRRASCTLRNGSGINPVACTCVSLPVLGTTWTIGVAASPNTVLTLAYAAELPSPFPIPLFGGELLIDPAAIGLPGNLVHAVPLPLLPQYLGYQLFVQGVRVEVIGPTLALQLTNAQDAVLGQ